MLKLSVESRSARKMFAGCKGLVGLEYSAGGRKMKKVLLKVIPLLIVIGFVYMVFAAFSLSGLKLVQSKHALVQGPEYRDEYVEVKMASAEGKYVIKVTSLIPDVSVYYSSATIVNRLKELSSTFDEVKMADIKKTRIRINNKGVLQKQIRLVEMGDLQGIPQYESIAKARQMLGENK